MKPSILERPELQDAAKYFAWACEASRLHSAMAAEALEKYGDHGAQVSGIVREHFPDAIKDRLRELARQVTVCSDKAYQAKPPRVQMSTMRKLSKAIAKRDGSGCYGPQA